MNTNTTTTTPTATCTCCGRHIRSPKLLRHDARVGTYHGMAIPEDFAGPWAPFGVRCVARVAQDAKEALYEYRCKDAGALAFEAGLPASVSPYSADMGAGFYWLQGYENAATEKAAQAIRAAQQRARLNPRLEFPCAQVVA